MKKVSVSFFNSKNIEEDIIKINSSSADYIHIDVGDGKFIESRFNPIKELNEYNGALTKRLDVHLMCSNPLSYIDDYSLLNTEDIIIHCEVKQDILNLLDHIKSYGIKTGLAISPDTDISFIEPFIDDIDIILIMSVVPGKSGQSFIYHTVDRIKEIKDLIKDKNIELRVDGGIDNETVKLVDVDTVISQSYVLNGDIEERINNLR